MAGGLMTGYRRGDNFAEGEFQRFAEEVPRVFSRVLIRICMCGTYPRSGKEPKDNIKGKADSAHICVKLVFSSPATLEKFIIYIE